MQLPQTPPELIAYQLGWAHKNINNNLGFVPADKLDWKPAPTSKSVLEIINHATGAVHAFTHAITGSHHHDLPPATDAQSAKALVTQVIEAHLKVVSALTPAEMDQVVSTPIGDLPKGAVAGVPVIEMLNHHGQITYIQSLLGDEESHLVFS